MTQCGSRLVVSNSGRPPVPDIKVIARAGDLPACQMIFDIVGDLLADGRQLKQLVLDDRIVGLLGTLPVHGRLIPEIVRPIHTGTPIPVEDQASGKKKIKSPCPEVRNRRQNHT